MSTDPSPTPDPKPMTEPTPTEIAARGRTDPWAADDETAAALTAARAPRQFEPTASDRLRNLVDRENAYCS